MPFLKKTKEEVLVKSNRCCCVCNEFCGRNCEVHHIIPEAEGGSSDIENAIVLCQKCHAEAGHYSTKHPKGNKYSPSEIKKYRDNWWEWVEENPYRTPPKYPISVSPDEMRLGTGEWGEFFKFNLHNNDTKVHYQINLKIFQIPMDFNPKKISIRVSSKRENLSMNRKGTNIDWDVVRMWGKDDEGHTAILLWISSLNPSETCSFIFSKHQSSKKGINLERGKIIFQVCGFSEVPPRILENEKSTCFPFKVYGGFKPLGGELKKL